MKADLIFDAKATLGEGAIWHSQKQVLFWVDILGKRFWRFDPATGQQEPFEVGQFVGTIVPRRKGGVREHALCRGQQSSDGGAGGGVGQQDNGGECQRGGGERDWGRWGAGPRHSK